jgi:hypothetical protein
MTLINLLSPQTVAFQIPPVKILTSTNLSQMRSSEPTFRAVCALANPHCGLIATDFSGSSAALCTFTFSVRMFFELLHLGGNQSERYAFACRNLSSTPAVLPRHMWMPTYKYWFLKCGCTDSGGISIVKCLDKWLCTTVCGTLREKERLL